ncbi:hypothetical protein [Saccharospirillum impatiens]|uniref:hypothetical protein n=1 Tax=Saccharospirillum impatiens TaxID=169438 RepID=UPI0003FD7745|nr:hypothetical protein [Saccharospirillum impatiens]
MKKIVIAATLAAATLASTAYAGGRGGAELGLASYGGGVGFIGAIGFPIRVPAFQNNGLNTYGELELGAGFADEVAIGGDLSLGLLFPLDAGLDLYASLGPGIGADPDADFGLAAEVGLNILINNRILFIEGGAHPGNSYFTVGLHF